VEKILILIECTYACFSTLCSMYIYIGVGKEGLTPTAIPRVMEEDAKLLSEKIKGLQNANIKVYYDYLPQEDHATILHQAVANSFKLLYTKQPK